MMAEKRADSQSRCLTALFNRHFVPKSAAARNKLAQFLFGGSREIARY